MRHFPLFTILLAGSALLLAGCQSDVQAAASAPDTTEARSAQASSRFTLPATAIDGSAVHELSGLAWDADDELLYAVSDKGSVFHFRLTTAGSAIRAVEPVFAAALADPDGKTPTHKKFNAEGLALLNGHNGVKGDAELVIAMEGSAQPDIVRTTPAGKVLGTLPVPAPLDDYANFEKKKRGLESVAMHPEFGVLTAPESPLSLASTEHTVYAAGRYWSFPRYAPDSRLKGLDVLADGTLLVLERSEIGASQELTASVRKLDLARCAAGAACKPTEVAVLPAGFDNFEGIVALDDGRILLVSDDKGGKHGLRTTLVLLPPDGAGS